MIYLNNNQLIAIKLKAKDVMEVSQMQLSNILQQMEQNLNQLILILLKMELVNIKQERLLFQVFKVLQEQDYKQQLNHIQFQSVLMPPIGVTIKQEFSVIAIRISIMQLWLQVMMLQVIGTSKTLGEQLIGEKKVL